MNENSLVHYGVMGMKWGRRKSKSSKGSNHNNSSNKSSSKKVSNIKKKVQNITSKIDKQKVKTIAKATAITLGTSFTAIALASLGDVAYRSIVNSGEVANITWYNRNPNNLDSTKRDQVKLLNINNKEISGPINKGYLDDYYWKNRR